MTTCVLHSCHGSGPSKNEGLIHRRKALSNSGNATFALADERRHRLSDSGKVEKYSSLTMKAYTLTDSEGL